jgi:hypothetical protein
MLQDISLSLIFSASWRSQRQRQDHADVQALEFKVTGESVHPVSTMGIGIGNETDA